MQAFTENDFTDTSLADLTKHLSFENKVNNNFVLDKNSMHQNESFMDYQIQQNLMAHGSDSTGVSSRMLNQKANKSFFNNKNLSEIKQETATWANELKYLANSDSNNMMTSNLGASNIKGFNDINDDGHSTSFSKITTANDKRDDKSLFDPENTMPPIPMTDNNRHQTNAHELTFQPSGHGHHGNSVDNTNHNASKELINLNIRVK